MVGIFASFHQYLAVCFLNGENPPLVSEFIFAVAVSGVENRVLEKSSSKRQKHTPKTTVVWVCFRGMFSKRF